MKRAAFSEEIEPPATSAEAETSLNIAVVYQDTQTHEWAMQKCRKATQLVGQEYVHSTWWQLDFLSHPRMMLDAVKDAVSADILIVSVYEAEEVPPALSDWVEALLSRRPPIEGALVALLGVPEQRGSESPAIGEYLRAVAIKGQMEFLPQEFKVPAESPALFREQLAKRAETMTHVLGDILSRGSGTHYRWGLNE